MPPEPLPWDRKDFFREKKQNGGGGYDRVPEPLGGPVARWRDTPSHGSRNDYGRWGFPSEYRRPPGHGKQGGWHLYSEDLSHGYPPTRSGDRFFQGGGGFRSSGPYRDGRYSRNFRENRASFSQREWRGHSWDYNHHHGAPHSGPGRLYDGKDHKSVDGAPARWSRPQLDVASTSNLVRLEEQHDESCDVNKEGTGERVEKEEPLATDWKPFKWSRPGSLTSRGSGFSLSSSSKGAGESCDIKIDLPLKISTPDESSSGDAVGCFASPTSPTSMDNTPRKKPRLGWGEGLAKYEKKKVEGPDDSQSKGSSSALCTSNTEPMHSPVQNWADKSPMIGGFFECRSPTTPSSVAYSSSPGMDDKSSMKLPEIYNDAKKLPLSPALMPQNHFEGVSLNLGKMEIESFCNLNGLLTELLQKEEQSSGDSRLTKMALNKLLLWKGDISKVLESTESEIDSLENELKSLKSQPGSRSPGPKSSSSMFTGCKEKNCDESNIQRSVSLPVVSSGNVFVGGMIPYGNAVEEALAEAKDECIDSPDSATSKFTEALSSDKPCSPDQRKHGHSMDSISLESVKFEACTSHQVQNKAKLSSPDSEIKVTKDVNHAPGPENMDACDNLDDSALDYILVSNKETANKASKLLGNLLPGSHCGLECIEAMSSTCISNNLLMEKFLKRKRSLRFKARILSMKYKALRYMWKEDLKLLSDRKYRTKSQKKVDSGLRSLHNGFQKHRSSIRSRFTSPACNASLFPTSEAVSFTSKLLSDPQMRCYRDNMKMPDLILDKKEKMLSRFLSNNGLVQDPYAVERERSLINPWTSEEKELFLDKYATFGKDFTKISHFLDHKTTADCIEFYYKNHKFDRFKKVKKLKELKKQDTSAPATRYLMTSEKKWSKEMNAASLDMLGAIVARDTQGIKSAKILSISGSDKKFRGSNGPREMSNSYNIEDERETEAADVLAGICGSLSFEAMSSCITSSADPGEGAQDWKSWKTSSEPSGTRCPPTAEVTQNVDDDTCSDESYGYVEPVDWTDEEKSSFVRAFSSHGKDFVMISRCVRTKSRDQCKLFFSKARKSLGLEILCPRPGDEDIRTADDPDGGQSDTEDACVVENDLATCGDKSDVGTDEKTLLPISNTNQDDSAMNLHDKVDQSDVCAPVRLDENHLKGRSQNEDCQQEDTTDVPDDGTVLNEEVANTVRLQYHERYAPTASDCGGEPINGHDTVMSEQVKTGTAETGTPLSDQQYTVAEIGSEKPDADLKSGSLDNQDVCLAPFSDECGRDELLKRSASANDLHQLLHCQTCPDFGESRSGVSSHLQPSTHPCLDNQDVCLAPFSDECGRDGLLKRSASANDLHQILHCQTCPDFGESRSGVSSHLQPSTHPCLPRTDNAQPLQVFLKKCQRVASVQSVGEFPLLSKSHSQMCGSGPDHHQHLSDASEKPSRNVKIFGQILSKPSTMDKRASDIQVSSSSSSGCEGSGLDVLPVNKEMGKYVVTNGPLGLESFPVKSPGFWDGSRILTKCSSIPDSTLLRARYPAVFGSLSRTTSTIEQQLPGRSVVNASKSSLLASVASSDTNGVFSKHQSAYPTKQDKMQEILLEVPRNGFQAVPGLQQIELNVLNGDGRAGGSSCNGLTDPVAALKLHYAKTQKHGGDVGR